MDRAPAHSDQEVELDVSREDQALEGLESHAAQEEGAGPVGEHAAIPGVEGRDLAASAEHGAADATHASPEGAHGETPGNAVSAIDPKISAARTKMWTKQQNARLKAQKARIAGRNRGKDWTAQVLADTLKNQGAQGVIIALNTHKTAEGIAVLKTANQWDPLLAALPVGKLIGKCKTALNQMVSDNLLDLTDAKRLFQIRFGINPTDASSTWTMPLLAATWRQLDALPDQDVTLNTMITTFNAVSGGGGSYAEGATTVDVGQGIGGDYEYLDNTVRHEIGHGVHAQIKGEVNQWLANDMGFVTMPSFRAWIDALGGFPAHFTDSHGNQVAFDAGWQSAVVQMVENYTGSGSWNPAAVSPAAGQHADLVAAWNAMPAAVKNACAQSTSNWYLNYANFQVAGGKHYFLNHWYHQPYVIGAKAFQTIPQTNDMYSAMSDFEFFATCYAEYFRDPTGAKNHKNWGGNLSGTVKSFFSQVVVQRHPYSQFQKSMKKKHT